MATLNQVLKWTILELKLKGYSKEAAKIAMNAYTDSIIENFYAHKNKVRSIT